MKNKTRRLSAYTILHFCVDFTCIYYLMCVVSVGVTDHWKWITMAVLYNAMAFALPAFMGLAADTFDRCESIAAIGCVLVAIGLVIPGNLYASVVLIGLGNGMFHVGAGRRILKDSRRKYAPCGIFISAGAVGVYLGNYFGSQHTVLQILFVAIMVLSAIILLLIGGYERKGSVIEAFTEGVGSEDDDESLLTDHKGREISAGNAAVCFTLLMLTVAIRSYYGYQTVYDWKNGFLIGLAFAVCIALGKFTGGVIADRAGIMLTVVVSMAIAGFMSLFSFSVPVCGLMSILFFNMTMPLTLSLMHRTFEKLPGFSFGILMLALFAGTLPSMVWNIQIFSSPWGLALMCAVSLILMLACIYLMKRAGRRI